MRLPLAAALAALTSGCALERQPAAPGKPAEPAVIVEQASPTVAGDVNIRAMLAFYRKSRGMSPAELTRERAALQGKVGEPLEALRLAMLLGHERSDLVRALGLLDDVARADSPQALALQPLVRLLADQYAERLKLEARSERLASGLRDTEQKAAAARSEAAAARAEAAALQEKIDALAEIERNLPGRPAPPVPTGGSAR